MNKKAQFEAAIRQMIEISEDEMDILSGYCRVENHKRFTILSEPGKKPNEVYFVNKGLIRVIITDREGNENSMHFALENNFIADYSSFLLKSEGIYTLRTEEDTEVVVLPRAAIEWGYEFLTQGDRLGRVIAEYLFIFMDHKRRDLYAKTPVERYESITDIYPNIHNRVPQHMIASYLGITPVHLSRLKKASQGVKV